MNQDTIAQLQQTFVEIFARGDAEAIAALYTEDGQLFPPGSDIVTGREAITAFWVGAMKMGVKSVKTNTLEIDHQGDTVIEVGRVTLCAAGDAVIDSPKYIIVWKCIDGQWKIHRDIWNSDIDF